MTTRYDAIDPDMTGNLTRLPGENQYSISASDADSGIDVIKYTLGIRTAEHFHTGGTVVADGEIFHNNFANYYTIYSVDNAGNEIIEVLNKQNIIPSIDDISDISIDEDTPVTIPINASDVEGSALTVTVTSSNPAVIADFAGTESELIVSPAANMHGEDITLTVEVSDGTDSTTTTFVVDVNSVNDEPTVPDFDDTVAENNILTIDPLLNVTDEDTIDILTLENAVLTSTNGSSVLINGDEITYSPAQYFVGEDTIDYTVNDGTVSVTGTITVTVTNINQSPVALDDNETTYEDVAKQITVLDNDTDHDMDYQR